MPLGTAATLSSGRGVTISVANNIAVITASLLPLLDMFLALDWTGAALTFTTVNDIDFEGNATISSGQNPTVVQYYTNGGSLNAGNTFALANGPTIGNLLVCIITNSAAGGVPSPGAQFTFQAGDGASYGGAAIYTALYDGTISAVGTVGSGVRFRVRVVFGMQKLRALPAFGYMSVMSLSGQFSYLTLLRRTQLLHLHAGFGIYNKCCMPFGEPLGNGFGQ